MIRHRFFILSLNFPIVWYLFVLYSSDRTNQFNDANIMTLLRSLCESGSGHSNVLLINTAIVLYDIYDILK